MSERRIILQKRNEHKIKNEKVQEWMGKREKIEKDDWVLVYDDKSTIAGGGKNALHLK